MEFDLTTSMPILARTPTVVRALLSGLDDAWTANNYGPQTWSAKEIVAHFIWADRTDWLPRARHILEFGQESPFPPFDRQGHEPLCREHSLPELLEIFAQERAENLRELAALELTPELLQRQGKHPALGTATLGQLLATWTVHDLNHIAQICKAVSYQYKSAVGPWEAYLSILSPPDPR